MNLDANTEAVNKAVKLRMQVEAMERKLENVLRGLRHEEYSEYIRRVSNRG